MHRREQQVGRSQKRRSQTTHPSLRLCPRCVSEFSSSNSCVHLTMQYAMLLAVLLPVALAALCTCPSPSPEDTVCGSDGRTYASSCELQCAALPGLFAAHPGPCNTTVVASRRRRYTVELEEWSKCHAHRQCVPPHWGNCKECGEDDKKCRTMCAWNCSCGCMRLPTGGLDEDSHDRWDKCYQERECTMSKREECQEKCWTQSCREWCTMDRERCSCGCIQHVADTRTSTTAAPTTSTTTAPTTSTTTAPTTSTTTAPTTSSTPSATEVETNNRGTTVTVDWTWRNYMTCVEQSRECGRDSLLADVRRANCTCGCMGLPGGDLEAYDGSAAVQTCLADCGGLSCKKRCQKDECHDNCHLRELRCRCECNHRGGATPATSTDTKLNN